ncbi:YopX protein [Cellulophaga phage phi19:3]|uniref:YopX protein n=1 Tax=Cellulophaga phage phi19:3 TaxID=1327971 RepID=R9ZYU4_9CAUD|nr:YopX protein [Cellulophaga phage phi19:3]AGO47462.1 YopX protein [Cellulophaga phage phi19:3]
MGNTREIKFRYRLKLVSDDWGRYKEGDIDVFYFSLNDKQSGLYRFAIDERWDVVSCDEYTGLKDKDGNEIYEGDILNNNTIVVFSLEQACYFSGGVPLCMSHSHREVIGNIHENPELIDKN